MMLMKSNHEKGTAAIEFAIVMTMLLPLFFGMLIAGVTAGRGIQAVQFTRDMGHMYGLGMDFSQVTSQATVSRLAQGLDTSTTGNGVVILSQIKLVAQVDCDAYGVTGGCQVGQNVFTHRLVLGNPLFRPSNFGTPDPTLVDSSGNISPVNYLTNPATSASNVGAGASSLLPTVPAGSQVWVCETYFTFPILAFLNSFGIPVNGVYSVTYF